MAPSGGERERAADDDDEDEDEDDASGAKQRANRSEAVSYGPNDDEDDEIQKQLQRDTDDTEEGEERLDFVDEAYGGSPEPEDEMGDKTDEERSRSREARIKGKNEHVAQFRCDEVGGEWVAFTLEFDAVIPKILMLSLVQEAVKKSVIQQIHRIGKATFEPKKKKDEATGEEVVTEMLVHTDGSNLRAMQQYGDYINPNRISTNDIAQVLEVYGVEACRSNIVGELSGVFSGHGISVDPRHLNLIADYMTRWVALLPQAYDDHPD
jgi:DNA-directed RNA polymerase I subunit RPA1